MSIFADRDPVAYAKHFLDLQRQHRDIAGSVTTIRLLIAEAERLQAEIERLRAIVSPTPPETGR